MNRKTYIILLGLLFSVSSYAQMSQQQKTRVQGNTEINVTTNNMTAVAAGDNNVAKNRVGVIQGQVRGDMRVNVAAGNVTTIAAGRNKKACTNIGGVTNNECK